MELPLTSATWVIILVLCAAGAVSSFAKFKSFDEGVDEILKRYPKLIRERLERARESISSFQKSSLENNINNVFSNSANRLSVSKKMEQQTVLIQKGVVLTEIKHRSIA